MKGTNKAYIALGSNVGGKEENLHRAVCALAEAGEVEAVSSFITTKPEGYASQDDFLNGALILSTALPPEELLKKLKEAEAALGRVTTFKNGPRVIDLDIIFYNDLVLAAPHLTIPHPRAHERAFVLIPMAEIAPNYVHPVLHKTVLAILEGQI